MRSKVNTPSGYSAYLLLQFNQETICIVYPTVTQTSTKQKFGSRIIFSIPDIRFSFITKVQKLDSAQKNVTSQEWQQKGVIKTYHTEPMYKQAKI